MERKAKGEKRGGKSRRQRRENMGMEERGEAEGEGEELCHSC